MTYNFDTKLNTKNFTVEIDTQANYGYFEHNTKGDECGGGLLFQTVPMSEAGLKKKKVELIYYDGVFALPKEVISALRTAGYIVDEDFE